MISPGTFNTPAGFAERATLIDRSAPHQIRIIAPGASHLWVSCTCRRGSAPIARITTCEEAWAAYNSYHEEE
jgi:hypothetical protein